MLTVADFLSTLTVEAAVHHLDLVAAPGPSRARRPGRWPRSAGCWRVCSARPLPARWDDVTAARRGTGREPLTDEDRAELGDAAGAFPLFG